MNPSQCLLRARQEEQAALVRVEGRATMNQSPALRRFAEDALAHGAAALSLDLRGCTYMDSTFAGTLLYLQRAVQRRHAEFALVAPSPECGRLLQQLGLYEMLPIVTAESCPAPTDWRDSSWTLLSEEPDRQAFQRDVVQAHQELASLPGPAGEAFRTVAASLQAEIDVRR